MTMNLDQASQLKQGDQLIHDVNGDSFSVVSVEPMLFSKIHIALVDNKTGEKTFANESMFDVLSVSAGNAQPPVANAPAEDKPRRGRKSKQAAGEEVESADATEGEEVA